MAESTRLRGVICEDAGCERADGGGRAGCPEGDESASGDGVGKKWKWDGKHTVDEEEYSYITTYFVLFLLARGGVVDRASREADHKRVWDVGETS
jgi:hypothetical protein